MTIINHDTVIIDPSAKIGSNVTIGPYSIIKANVEIGDGAVLENNVTIGPNTIIAENCIIHTGAVIGGDSQDLKYKGGQTFARVGSGTVIREYVTINRGTDEGSWTVVGNKCLVMAYTHIAHNCEIGNEVIIANSGTFAGYVIIHDRAIIGGLVGIHQFCRVGTMAIVGGCSKIVYDILPYASADGNPAKIRTINSVGLTRQGYSKEKQQLIRQTYKTLFDSDLRLVDATKKLKEESSSSEEIINIVNFIESSQRGIAR